MDLGLCSTGLHAAARCRTLGGALGWPHGLQPVLALALILGTPIVAVIAWYHGARGLQRVTGTELLIVASLLALGGTYIWRAQSTHETQLFAVDNAEMTSVRAAPAEASIAVLAFADMSPGKDQEYFSDGMAEEILNALARVAGLKVAGRTSSFSFKGKNIDSKAIGESLNVAQILEGSVRKQGERVRITAQLLRAKDGFNVWSDSYDGTLADIFDLQERIAAREGPIDRLLKNDPINPTALTYKGLTRLINGDPEQMMQASERAIALGYPVGHIGMSIVAAQRGDQVRAAAEFVRGWGAIHSAFSAQDLAAIYGGVDGDAKACAIALAIVDAHTQSIRSLRRCICICPSPKRLLPRFRGTRAVCQTRS